MGARYVLHRGGPGVWYCMDTGDSNRLYGPHRTREAALAVVVDKNQHWLREP
jgi:hypothetical protein